MRSSFRRHFTDCTAQTVYRYPLLLRLTVRAVSFVLDFLYGTDRCVVLDFLYMILNEIKQAELCSAHLNLSEGDMKLASAKCSTWETRNESLACSQHERYCNAMPANGCNTYSTVLHVRSGTVIP